MTRLSTAQIYTLAHQAGFSSAGATLMTAIAMAESGGDPNSVGDVGLENGTWGPSVGLWQVRSLRAETGRGTSRDVNRLKDPAFNARSAFEISGKGKSFRPWTTYTSGAYRRYLGGAKTAAGASPAPLPPTSATDGATGSGAVAGDSGTGVAGQTVGLAGDALNFALLGPAGLLLGHLFGDLGDSGKAALGTALFRGAVTVTVVVGGIALVVLGASQTVAPVTGKVKQAAALAAAPETGGASLAAAGGA